MLLDNIKQTIAHYNMLEDGDRIIVAVSGGPDSIALLYVLNSLKKEFNLKLFVAHLNHMIRKKGAEEDALFVKKTAEKLKLQVVIELEDIPKMAKGGKLSLEEAARIARYNFYLKVAERLNANKIALGHTQDDQAETVLMRLIRGSGLLGLSGIPPTRNLDEKIIIRPLIEISKEEIIRFLNKKRILFRQDITNIQPIYFRSKIRQRLLPFLEKGFNPEIKKVLEGIGKNLRIDYEYLSKIAEKKFRRYALYTKEKVKINLKFLKEDLALQRLIIREAIKKVKGDLNSVTYSHWEDLNALLKKKTNWSLDLPDKVLVKKIKDNLVFCKRTRVKKLDLSNVSYQLEIPGKIKIFEINKIIEANFIKKPKDFKFSARGGSAFGGKKSKKEEYFDFEKLKLPLFVRFRKPKDKIKPLGMASYKRLKQLFIDEKIPVEKRGKIPLVISRGKIIWICGVKRSEEAKITEETRGVVRIRIKRDK